MFGFFRCLSQDETISEHIEQLTALYQSAKPEDLLNDLNYLFKYQAVNKETIPKVARILLLKANQEPQYTNVLKSLFYPYSDTDDDLINIFKNDMDTLKEAYLVSLSIDNYHDYDGQFFSRILDADTSFLVEYLSRMYSQKSWFGHYDNHINFSFIWLRDDHLELMQRITDFIYKQEKGRFSFGHSYLSMFFILEDGASANDMVREKQDRFLLNLIKSHFEAEDFMDLVFGVVCEFAPERRVQFIASFIVLNKNFESFKRLLIEPGHWNWSGSQVPVLQGRVDYIASLLPLFNTMPFLEHRQYLEQKVQYLRDYMEQEKKKDFLEDEV